MNTDIDFFQNLVGSAPIPASFPLFASLLFPPFPLPPTPLSLSPFPTPLFFHL